jgi:hypothetical protein
LFVLCFFLSFLSSLSHLILVLSLSLSRCQYHCERPSQTCLA